MIKTSFIDTLEKKIYYHDTDAGGVVYYANYLKYFEEARTEFFAHKSISVSELHHEGFLYAVRSCNITYHAPARYGDIIVCETSLDKITAAQFFFHQNIKLKSSGSREPRGQLLVEAQTGLVNLNKEFKTTPIPDSIRTRLTS